MRRPKQKKWKRTCLTTASVKSHEEFERHKYNERRRNQFNRRRSKSVDFSRPHGLHPPKNITCSTKYIEKRAQAQCYYRAVRDAKGTLPPPRKPRVRPELYDEKIQVNPIRWEEPKRTMNKVIEINNPNVKKKKGIKPMTMYIAIAICCCLISVAICGAVFVLTKKKKKSKDDDKKDADGHSDDDDKCTLEKLGLLEKTIWESDGDKWIIGKALSKQAFPLMDLKEHTKELAGVKIYKDPKDDECKGHVEWKINKDSATGEFTMKVGNKDTFELTEKRGDKDETKTFTKVEHEDDKKKEEKEDKKDKDQSKDKGKSKDKKGDKKDSGKDSGKDSDDDRRRMMFESTASYFSFHHIVISIIILIATVYWHRK